MPSKEVGEKLEKNEWGKGKERERKANSILKDSVCPGLVSYCYPQGNALLPTHSLPACAPCLPRDPYSLPTYTHEHDLCVYMRPDRGRGGLPRGH